MSKILVAVVTMLVAVFVAQAAEEKKADAKPAAAAPAKADAKAAPAAAKAVVPATAAGKLEIKKDGAKVTAITIVAVDGKAVAIETEEAIVKMVEPLAGKNVEAKLTDKDNDGLAEVTEIKEKK